MKLMKFSILILLFEVIVAELALAAAPIIPKITPPITILKCLGVEEGLIHAQRISGPVYLINAEILNELTVEESIQVKNEYLQKICSFKTFTPSLWILRDLLLRGENIFILTDDAFGGKINPAKATVVQNLIERAPELMVAYITALQALTPLPDCLRNNIPELQEYLTKYNYYENEAGSGQVLYDKKLINAIFNKLEKFDSIYVKCQADSERLKKLEKKRRAEKEAREAREAQQGPL
ncbi:MAG: hypothetical protein HQK50_13825 [Oligoflexia bacterium]|nr:hypothetical protein [Oligoflexia bacterium]MBF0366647.1 hypothetical protein [Oligoflexia bacterium]